MPGEMSEQEKLKKLQIEIEEEKRFIELLKEKIGYEVKLTLHTELRAEVLHNMSGEPRISDEEYLIIFLGIYGFNERYGFIGKRGLYIHGRDQNGKEKLYRNNIEIWGDENTGCSTWEEDTSVVKLDDIAVGKLLSFGPINEDKIKLKEKIKTAEPDIEEGSLERLAKGLLEGMPHYRPGVWCSSSSIIDDPKFIKKVLTYFERII